LGTAPRIKSKYSIRYAAIVQACHAFRERECSTPKLLRRGACCGPRVSGDFCPATGACTAVSIALSHGVRFKAGGR